MTFPFGPEPEGEEEPVDWGVDRDPPERPASSSRQIIWLILSILIILSLVLPWILSFFAPRPPVREGLQAMLSLLW